MPELDLGLGPGECKSPLECCGVAMLVRQLQGLLAGGRDDSGKNDSGRRPRRDTQRPPEAYNGIENWASGLAEGRAVENGNRIASFAVTAYKSRAVSLVLDGADRVALNCRNMRQPHRGFLVGLPPPSGEQSA